MSDRNTGYRVWLSHDLSQSFIEGIRGAVPFAVEQIDLVLRLVAAWRPEPDSFLDLGCGDGILGRALLNLYPQARAVFVDFSEHMLAEARRRSPPDATVEFIAADFAGLDWLTSLGQEPSFDVVVSGFAIHHQPDDRKRELYQEVYHLLRPGGLFLNLEHVAPATAHVEQLFDEYFIDALYGYSRQTGQNRPRREIAAAYYSRPDAGANILAPVEDQCAWLREIGFVDVDCFFKILELALFGGRKG